MITEQWKFLLLVTHGFDAGTPHLENCLLFLCFRWNQLHSSESPPWVFCFFLSVLSLWLCSVYVLHLPLRVFLGAREQYYLKQLMLEWQVSAGVGDTRRFFAALCCINLHNNDESAGTLGLRASCLAPTGPALITADVSEPRAKASRLSTRRWISCNHMEGQSCGNVNNAVATARRKKNDGTGKV